jgi:NAD+ dependent glucose-6-phosphate dehydrogenase
MIGPPPRPDRLRVAITGSSGIIGAVLTADLTADPSFEVVPVDRARADILDLAALRRAFAGCDALVHLAGGVLRDGSWDEVWELNLLGLRNVLTAAVDAGCRRVVYASSLHVLGLYEEQRRPGIYAPGPKTLLGTDVEPRPVNPYALTKVCGEVIARYFSDVHGLYVTCVRIGTMNVADSPLVPDAAARQRLRDLPDAERRARLAAKWFSHADFARLTRAILRRDVRFAIVYGVGDNPGRYVDLEPGRELFDFQPDDGALS